MKKMKIYVPGLLSLLFLSPLLLYQLSQWHIFDKEYALEVNWYSPAMVNQYMQKFPPSRDYTTINLTGNTSDDYTKIEFAKVILNEMIVRFDTIRGVRINFSDTTKYESFVEVLNFCSQQDGLAYAPYESDIWIFNRFKSEKQKKSMWLGSCIILTPLNVPKVKTNFAWDFAYSVDIQFWPIALLFILLIHLNFRRRLWF